ncbi:MAG: DUF116 domain-containing protein [Candidatus Bathyarchaeota archaeon]|nr:DUF116 domain-containing protein [Candidatus Bathyarchaeota archaeon]
MESYQRGVHKVFLNTLQDMVKRFRIQEATGLNVQDAVLLIQDLIDMQALNLMYRKRFLQTKKRALFLPHCSRKYMDGRCKADFDPTLPSYICNHCSQDCAINKADQIAREKGYDVYILAGGSCIPQILNSKQYEGIVGVACGGELKLSDEVLNNLQVAGQAVPLLKNGCANTKFNLTTLTKTL